MTTTQEELLASTIQKQIAILEALLQELVEQPEKTQSLLARIQQVEKKLHELRARITF